MQQLSLPLDLPNFEQVNSTWFTNILNILGVSNNPGWVDDFGKSLRKYLIQKGNVPIKTLSLFSGGGGLDIAFHDAGFEIVQMVELEAKYVNTLQQNSLPGKWLSGSEAICIDIRNYLPETNLKVDFMIGGPPCQSFSAAGRRAAGVAGITNEKGTLFREYVRILQTLQPKGFLFENVYGITGANRGQAWLEIQQAFRKIGYKIFYRILDAADYGVPQHRERLFIVGVKEGEYLFPYPTHGPDSLNQQPYYCAGEAVKGADISDVEVGIGGKYGNLLEHIPPGLNYSFYTKEMGYPQPIFSWRSKFSDFLYKADPETPIRTIKAQGGQYTGPFSWENRRFSIAELKRLQTIPDDYKIVGNQQVCIEQIGNSVPPQMGRILALSILDQVMGFDFGLSINYIPENQQLSFRQRKRKLTEIYAQKAKAAIKELSLKGQIKPLGNKYEFTGKEARFISHEFNWTTESSSNESRKINLNYDLNLSHWQITAGLIEESKEDKFFLEVYPSSTHNKWFLSTNLVRLCAKDLDTQIFTSLWKAFEEKLTEATGIADLVQLSGYYQYNPKINAVMNFNPDVEVPPFWRIVQYVTKGMGIATQLSATELAMLWDVKDSEIFSHLKCLRKMGYEVRNNNTNSQIPKGKYLIPYAFPSLNPKSVQLRKSL